MTEEQTQIVLSALQRLEAGQARLEAGQAKLEAGQAKLEAGQAKLEAGQAELEAGVAELRAGLAEHAGVLVRLESRIDSLYTRLERLEANLERLEASHTRLRVEVMARIDRMQDKLGGILEDIAVNFGRADQVQRIARTFRDDMQFIQATNAGIREELHALTEVVSAIERKLRNLGNAFHAAREADANRASSQEH